MASLARRSDVIFGEPQQHGNITIIPVTREGVFGTKALGVVSIDDNVTSWVPTVDVDRLAFIGVLTGLLAATLGSIAVVKRPPWPTSEAIVTMNRERLAQWAEDKN